ncbi:MAG: Xanthine and dehydrogenase maturation factor, XdhC/CoxF family [Myxococcaceae bacterium]|nr:Xanthine and dehydrogenase maturation factor, XdhC/CoxF family [Myxococcaceae bacterium]
MAKPIPLSIVPALADRAARVATPADATSVLELAAANARRGVRGAIATVMARHGSAPGTPGQKLYAGADGSCIGTVGGGAMEREVIAALDEMLSFTDAAPTHHVRSFRLGAELGMCCGGSIDLMLEPLEALTACLIIGGGHVATATAPLLARVGFAVTVSDEREAWAEEGRLAGVRSVVGEFDDVGKEIPTSGAVLVMTHDHALDQKAIEWALSKGFAYVGGIGSRAKAQRTKDRLEAKGFSLEDRTRVRMPIGASIGARLPDEIAVAIAAEMVAWRKRGGAPDGT